MTLAINMGEKANTAAGGMALQGTFDFMLERPANFDSMKEKLNLMKPKGTLLFSQNQSICRSKN